MTQQPSTTTPGLIDQLHELAGRNPSTQALLEAAEDYLSARAEQAISTTEHRIEEFAARLEGSAAGAGRGPRLAGPGAAQRDSDGGVKDGESSASSGQDSSQGGGGNSKGGATTGSKLTNIVEDVKIGVPLRQVYNQWTLYSEFADMMRGITGVDAQDEVTTSWKVKVAKSNRTMTATVVEQIPDRRIVWTSEGAKGSTRGVVTFHPLADDLTQVLVTIEYFPAGFVEKTANMWWAASRRTRLDIKHFRRHIMMNGEASDEGWRGEIRDGEVVRSHDEVVEAEQAEGDEAEEASEQGGSHEESAAAAPSDDEQATSGTEQPPDEAVAAGEADEAEGEGEEGEEAGASEQEAEQAGDQQPAERSGQPRRTQRRSETAQSPQRPRRPRQTSRS